MMVLGVHNKKIMFLLMLLSLALGTLAQSPPAKLWLARLDVYHQDWMGDFGIGQLTAYDRVFIRPGIRVGIERTWIQKNHFRLYQDLLLGYYHNTYDERSFTMGTDAGVEWRIFKQFRLALPIGIHFHRAKPIDIRYVYDGEKWVRAKNTDPSISRLQFLAGLNIGWRFWPAAKHPIEVFANGNISTLSPWQPDSGVPILLCKAAGMGLKVGI
jgi:hypothetical protein